MTNTCAAWLLQNQVNPFPIAGELDLGDGRLSFTLAGSAVGAALGWLEKRLGTTGLTARIAGGERVVAFDVPLDDVTVAWPMSLAKAGVTIHDGTHKWVVAFSYPSAGGVWGIIGMLDGRRTGRAWRTALTVG